MDDVIRGTDVNGQGQVAYESFFNVIMCTEAVVVVGQSKVK